MDDKFSFFCSAPRGKSERACLSLFHWLFSINSFFLEISLINGALLGLVWHGGWEGRFKRKKLKRVLARDSTFDSLYAPSYQSHVLAFSLHTWLYKLHTNLFGQKKFFFVCSRFHSHQQRCRLPRHGVILGWFASGKLGNFFLSSSRFEIWLLAILCHQNPFRRHSSTFVNICLTRFTRNYVIRIIKCSQHLAVAPKRN